MKNKHTALLSRLSKEDELIGESESIQTQKAMLEEYAKQHGLTNVIHYIDDGYSGTNFERPEFQRLVKDIKNNLIDTVIVKDLSRLGRDYLKVGYYLEEFFPLYMVRFISINDDIDSFKGIPELTPFKNIMNEWYAKDISKKIRSAYKIKALKGEFTASYAPYGYMKDPNDKHHLIIDYEVADVVKEIFMKASIGMSSYQIASYLKDKKILKPRAYMNLKYQRYSNQINDKYPYDWKSTTIKRIVENYEYCGHMVSNRNTKQSFKSKHLIKNDESKWIIVKNTHEAIVDEELYAKAKALIQSRKIVMKKTGERNLFSGLLRCKDCGKAMSVYKDHDFCCSTYRSNGKNYCSSHYIRYDILYNEILKDINYHIDKSNIDKEALVKELLNKYQIVSTIKVSNNEIKKLEKRQEEIRLILKRMYEDYILGKVSEIMYNTNKQEYDEEIKEISNKLSSLYEVKSKEKDIELSINRFIALISKYDHLETLTREVLNDLILNINVYQYEMIDKKRVQRIEINHNFLP